MSEFAGNIDLGVYGPLISLALSLGMISPRFGFFFLTIIALILLK